MKGLQGCANGTRPVKCTFRFSFHTFVARRGGPTLGLALGRAKARPRARPRSGPPRRATKVVLKRKAFQLKFCREVTSLEVQKSTSAHFPRLPPRWPHPTKISSVIFCRRFTVGSSGMLPFCRLERATTSGFAQGLTLQFHVRCAVPDSLGCR